VVPVTPVHGPVQRSSQNGMIPLLNPVYGQRTDVLKAVSVLLNCKLHSNLG